MKSNKKLLRNAKFQLDFQILPISNLVSVVMRSNYMCFGMKTSFETFSRLFKPWQWYTILMYPYQKCLTLKFELLEIKLHYSGRFLSCLMSSTKYCSIWPHLRYRMSLPSIWTRGQSYEAVWMHCKERFSSNFLIFLLHLHQARISLDQLSRSLIRCMRCCNIVKPTWENKLDFQIGSATDLCRAL